MAEEVRKESYNGQKEENNILTSYDEKIDEIVGSRDTVTISKEEYETLKIVRVIQQQKKKEELGLMEAKYIG